MTERSLPFNSVGGDRSYDADIHAKKDSYFIPDGVSSQGGGLAVTASGISMVTTVAAGMAYIQGHFYYNDAPLLLTHSTADPTYDRIDRIVARLDKNQGTRAINIVIKSGTPAPSPVEPSLQSDAYIVDIPIARVLITKALSTISQAKVTDERGALLDPIEYWTQLETTQKAKITADSGDFYLKVQSGEDAYAKILTLPIGIFKVYIHSGATNSIGEYWEGIVIVETSGAVMLFGYTSSSNFYCNKANGGTFVGWNRINNSASDILTKLKTVDGSGSGLDADTVRGQDVVTSLNVKVDYSDFDSISSVILTPLDGAVTSTIGIYSFAIGARTIYRINIIITGVQDTNMHIIATIPSNLKPAFDILTAIPDNNARTDPTKSLSLKITSVSGQIDIFRSAAASASSHYQTCFTYMV